MFGEILVLELSPKIFLTNQITVFLQYLKKELSCEVDVLYADKHESLCKLMVLFLMGLARHA